MPLHTLWETGTPGAIVFAVLHCSSGDVLGALAGALLLSGDRRWADRGYRRVAVAAGAIGLGYTLFSEWLDIEVRGAWAYRALMPVLPVIRPSADLTEYRCFGGCHRVRRARSAFERQMPTRNVSAHAMFGDVKGGFP